MYVYCTNNMLFVLISSQLSYLVDIWSCFMYIPVEFCTCFCNYVHCLLFYRTGTNQPQFAYVLTYLLFTDFNVLQQITFKLY